MAWSRLFQCGFEFRDVNELDTNVSYGSASSSISTTNHNTGTASYIAGGSAYPRGKAIAGTSTLSIRTGCYFKTAGTNAGKEGCLFVITGSKTIIVTYDTYDNLLRLRVDGTIVDSIALSSTVMTTVNVWYNLGIYVYSDSTNGRIGFYIGGELILEYDGNTGTYINGIYAGGSYDSSSYNASTYLDDFYADYSTSLESETAPPNLLFDAIKPTGDNTVAWSTFGSASHYANIDDTTPDSDSTYNYVTVANVADSCSLANFTVPSGFSIAAAIPTMIAKKTSAVTDPTLLIGMNENSTDAYGSGQSLTTTYAYYWERQTVAPDTDAWDDTNIDAANLIYKSGGTF